MATRRGDELPSPSKDPPVGNRHGPVKDLPDEWNFPGPWPDAEPDYMPKPGHKRYNTRDQMADDKPSDGPFKITKFPQFDGSKPLTLYTRKGRGLIDDDLSPAMSRNRKPGETMHQREDNDVEGYAQGGKVAPNNRFGFATPNKYTKR